MKAIFGIGGRAVLHDLGRAKRAAPMHDRHLGAKAREKRRLFHRGVAAAHHHRFLVLEERAVAGRARAHPVAHQPLFRFDPEQLGRRAGRDDERFGADSPCARGQLERPLAQIDRGYFADHELRAETLGLAPEHVHHLGTLDAVLEAGVVLDLGGDGELAAGLMALDQQRGEIGARRVERGSEARGTGTENHEAIGFVCHLFCYRLLLSICLCAEIARPSGRARFVVVLIVSCRIL